MDVVSNKSEMMANPEGQGMDTGSWRCWRTTVCVDCVLNLDDGCVKVQHTIVHNFCDFSDYTRPLLHWFYVIRE